VRLPTASKLPLALTCPASAVLPQVYTRWAAGEDGGARHEALERRVGGVVQDETPEVREWLASIDDETLAPLVDSGSEVTFSWRPDTGEARLVGSHLERAYPEEDGVIFGTADYCSSIDLADDWVEVADLKTGNGDVEPVGRNAQLRFLAMAAARWGEVSKARIGILHATGERTWWEWADLDAFELENVAVELRRLTKRIGQARDDVAAGRMPHLTVGEHCRWCAARHGCPARVAMAQRLAGEPEAVVRNLKALLTPETAKLALDRWRAASAALKEVGSALYAYAAEAPIPLGDGRVWGPVTSYRQTIDAAKAWPVLVGLWGADAARAAMRLETSKAGIGRGLEVAGGAGPKAARLRSVMDALDAAGAVGSKAVTEYEEHEVK
jgi:hypothetical protein